MSYQRRSFRGNRPPGRSSGNRIKYMRVDPQMLIKRAEPQKALDYQAGHRFSDFGLLPQIMSNVTSKGYTTPTPIQDQAIGAIMEGRDVIGLAATGTGKTAAFLLPLIHKVVSNPQEKVIIITPTRELAVQIIDEGRLYSRGLRAFFTLIIGGVDIRRQMRDLSRNPQFVVGTPGRIKDLVERRSLYLANYRTIVLDEVDRMLDMGFVHEIENIISKLPLPRHSLFFSATMSDKARAVAAGLLTNPVTFQAESQRASENVNQDIVRLAGKNKVDVLHDLLISPGFDKVLVFGRTKHGMEKLSRVLCDRGFSATAIHGNKSQSQRQRALRAFQNNEVKVLLATDVAARGIDIDNVTHVINYELPETYDDYIHRIGRTGRAGGVGTALTFVD